MLTRQLQIFLIVIFIGLLIWILREVKKNRLELRYTLSWLFLDIALLILSIFPQLLTKIARMLGIYSPVNMIFFMGFVFSLIIIYTLTVAISKMSREIKRITQKIALMEGDKASETDTLEQNDRG